MKKIVLIFICFFMFMFTIKANERYEAKLYKCVDGDTAWFDINGEVVKSRFLGINTPESTNKQEAYGKEASKYTCNMLKNAKKIEVEYDDNSSKYDIYDRHLLWIFVDDILLQNKLLEQGLAKVEYIYGDYEYLDSLYETERIAKSKKINIWSDYNDFSILNLIIVIVFIILMFIIYPKKTAIKKIKKYLK